MAKMFFLTDISSNILDRVNLSNFYVKVVPKFLGNEADICQVSATNIISTSKAKQPRNPGRLIATRVGSLVTLEIVPSTPGIPGAGDVFVSETDQPKPHSFGGVFLISHGATIDEATEADTISITNASAVTITVKHRIDNHISPGLDVFVDTPDGTYYA